MKLTLIAAVLFAVLVVPASADQGRALLDTGFPPQANPDAVAGQVAVALPDGGAVLFAAGGPRRGIAGIRMRPDGTLDPSFSAHISEAGRTMLPTGVLRRPDGRLVVTVSRYPRSVAEQEELRLVQLTADGAPDPSFGDSGVARTGLHGYAGAALAPNGTLVLAAMLGTGTSATQGWGIARVDATGAATTARLPGSAPGDASFADARVTADGRIVALGLRGYRALVARLLPDGSADPAWGGGEPVEAPVRAHDLAVGDDGSVTVVGDRRLARMRPDGTRDTAYGSVHLRDASFARLLAEPGGGVLVSRTPDPLPDTNPALVVDRVTVSGAVTTVTPRVRLGGGSVLLGGSTLGARRVRPLRQSGVIAGELLRRPDGSFLVAGGVRLVQYTGEGEGISSARHAVVALTPQLTVDRSFGPAFARPVVTARVLGLERTRFVARLRVRASAPGLLAVRVRDRRGRTLVRTLVPVHRAGRQAVRVRTTATGRRILRLRVAVRVTGRFRDLATREVALRATRGRLGG